MRPPPRTHNPHTHAYPTRTPTARLSQLRAVDAAGNVEVAGPSVTWQQRYPTGSVYTRLAASPPPLTNALSLPFSLYAFTVGGGVR